MSAKRIKFSAKEAGMMHGWTKRALVFAVTVTLILTTTGLQAADPDDEFGEKPTGLSMMADFVFLRPFGIAATAVGTVFFVGSLPFSAAGGNVNAAFQKLVKDPAEFTFHRPLGKLE